MRVALRVLGLAVTIPILVVFTMPWITGAIGWTVEHVFPWVNSYTDWVFRLFQGG